MQLNAEHGAVLRSGVVPDGDGILFPAEVKYGLRLLDPLDQRVQQRL